MKARHQHCTEKPKSHWTIQDLGSQNVALRFAMTGVTLIFISMFQTPPFLWLLVLSNQACITNRKLPMAVVCRTLLEESTGEYVKFIIYRLCCVSICNHFYYTVFPNRTPSMSYLILFPKPCFLPRVIAMELSLAMRTAENEWKNYNVVY